MMAMQTKARDTTNSPLTGEQADHLNRLVTVLSPDQLSWVSGYLAGLQSAVAGNESVAAPGSAVEQHRLTILYGSETGNAERIAEQAGQLAAARGMQVRVLDMAAYKARELRDERLLMIATATHGEGTPPDAAADFCEFLQSRRAPRLEGAKFSVLALGDSSYEHFCQTGRDLDARLEALGAERLLDRVDCDVDYEEAAERWVAAALDAFASHMDAAPTNIVAFKGGGERQAAVYDRRNPFQAEVLENMVLNGRGSAKETRHIELSLAGSGLDYVPGDVLCLLPQNRQDVIDELLQELGLSPDESVATAASGDTPLVDALRHEYEITIATPAFLGAYAELTQAPPLLELVQSQDRAALMRYLENRHVIDVLREFPQPGLGAQTLLGMLRRLQPREYSIASSHLANPEEVHLTLAVVSYQLNDRQRHGVASAYLSEQAEPGRTVPVYLRQNKNFRLPQDPQAPIVMIGPGTGVAPFRAFLQERELQGGSGRNWLVFGNQHFRTDFLYQTEWQSWLRDGVLDRIDLAFSRDTEHKVYVQDRLREQGAELYRWLEEGAYVYVCGDATHMAPDVHAALQEVVRVHGGHSGEAAEEYVKHLQREKRYQRDVY
jgi:sulfite reductase (NADPH) flavoprotein alpha-component